jgi:hypothetical protein
MHEFKASHMILIYQGCKPLHRNLKIAARLGAVNRDAID